MPNADKKWKSGFSARRQHSFREHVAGRPNHQETVDHSGVYYERKRLKSKYRGVSWSQRRAPNGEWREGRWHVATQISGITHFGGEFREENEIEAAHAYDDLVKRLRGVFAVLNFPSDDA